MNFRSFLFLLLLGGSLSLCGQDFMLQGWYWDYDKNGCNGFSGANWASRLNAQATALGNSGFTYVWLPPASRASFGACSNGYDPQDLYDLGEYGGGRTGLGTRTEVDNLIAALNANGMEAVADVVYNHRDGGQPEDNPAVKAYVETHFTSGKQPFPSDRYRLRLPLGAGLGAGDYYFKLSSKTQSYGPNQYKFYATVASRNEPFRGAITESEPNGGGDCGQPSNDVLLDQDIVGTLYDFSGCYTDEYHLVLDAADFNGGGDDLLIFLTNVAGGYSDHRIYGIYHQPADGSPGFNVNMADLKFQTYTDFTNLPSGQGGMNFENFRPNSANTSTTFMDGDFDSPLFFYDVVQEEASTATVYNDWSAWLLNDVGFGGLRMDAVKHFPPGFVSQLLDDLAGRGLNPGMVVGEFFDGNPTLLKDWVEDVNAGISSSTSLVRIFDFTLRDALKAACDDGNYDARNVFENSLHAAGLSGFNVVTFANNHDFRGPGEPIQNDALLAYAYLLTNNQIGLPSVFYPDYAGMSIPHAPTVNLSAPLSQLMSIHKDHIFGSPSMTYLNAYGSAYAGDYQQGGPNDGLIYQIREGSSGEEIVVVVNFGYTTLKVNQEIIFPAGRSNGDLNFVDLTGNAFNPVVTTANGRLLVDVPARSYAVYVSNGVLPVTLGDFTATVDDKGGVDLRWETLAEEALADFTVEASTDGRDFAAVGSVTPRQAPGDYLLEDDRPWATPVRYYRLRTTSADGSVQHGSVVPARHLRAAAQITPNPTTDRVSVSGAPQNVAWQLTDGLGRKLQSGRTSARFTVDLSRLPAGVYWLRTGEAVSRVVRR